MKPSTKFVTAALLLIACASTASAQSCWNYSECVSNRGAITERHMAVVRNMAAEEETSTDMVPPIVTLFINGNMSE